MTSTKEMEEEDTTSFSLKSGTDKFMSRTQDVFASLGALEDKHSAFLKATVASRENESLIKNDPDEDEEKTGSGARERNYRDARSRLSETRDSDYECRSLSRSRDRDSYRDRPREDDRRQNVDFRRPHRPPFKRGHQPVPDFKKHPEKYTCYTLADVSGKDMSERSNQKAAFAFLEERRLEREKQERLAAGLPEEELKFDVGTAACSQGKITFSRPRNKKEHHESDIGSTTEKHSSKHVTDELSSGTGDNEEDVGERQIDDRAKMDTDSKRAQSESAQSTFKARKNVKRHIRRKNSDEDSD